MVADMFTNPSTTLQPAIFTSDTLDLLPFTSKIFRPCACPAKPEHLLLQLRAFQPSLEPPQYHLK